MIKIPIGKKTSIEIGFWGLLLIIYLIISLCSCTKTGHVWQRRVIDPFNETSIDTIEMKFTSYKSAFALRKEFKIFELANNGHVKPLEHGWKAVVYVDDVFPEIIRFKLFGYFKRITIFEDRYTIVYVVDRTKFDMDCNCKTSIHVIKKDNSALPVIYTGK